AALQGGAVAAGLRQEAPEHALEKAAEPPLLLAVLGQKAAFQEVAEELLGQVLRVLDRRAARGADELVDRAPVEGEEPLARGVGFRGGEVGLGQNGRPDRLREIFPAAPDRRFEPAHGYC